MVLISASPPSVLRMSTQNGRSWCRAAQMSDPIGPNASERSGRDHHRSRHFRQCGQNFYHVLASLDRQLHPAPRSVATSFVVGWTREEWIGRRYKAETQSHGTSNCSYAALRQLAALLKTERHAPVSPSRPYHQHTRCLLVGAEHHRATHALAKLIEQCEIVNHLVGTSRSFGADDSRQRFFQ